MASQLKHPIVAGLTGGIISAIISGLLNYLLLPFPQTPMDNVIGHSVGGLFCGFASGFIGVLMYVKGHRRRQESIARPMGQVVRT